MRQTPVWNLLFALALVIGLLAAFPSASSGGPSTQVNVGGIDFKANDSGGSFSSSKIRERSQPVNTGPTSPDPSNRLLDRSQGGKSVQGTTTSTTTPSTSSTTNGTLQGEEYGKPGDAGEYGRPTSPFCSTTNITVGEEHRTTLHCPGGTLR
jgi:hypothetical protein